MTRPVRQLLGFGRVHLEAGEAAQFTFHVDSAQLALRSRERRWVIEAGEVDLIVGSSSDDDANRVTLTIGGPDLALEHRRTFVAAVDVRPAT